MVLMSLSAGQEWRHNGRSPGGGHGSPLWYSYLENPMDRGAWQARDHGVTKSWTRLKRPHSGDADIKEQMVDTAREGEGGTN